VTRRSYAAASLAAALATVAVAGCGKDDDDTISGDKTTAAAPPAKASPNAGKPPDLDREKVGATGPQVTGSYVAGVSRTNAMLAIVVQGSRVVAYMSDGLQYSQHFQGRVGDDGVIKLESDGQVKLDAKVGKDRAGGAVRLAGGGGEPLRFDAKPAAAPAGFYRGTRTYRGKPVVAEWVVGDRKGKAQRGVLLVDGKPRTAPTLRPGQKRVVIRGLGRLNVERVASPADVKF